jgi:hypothetical protein
MQLAQEEAARMLGVCERTYRRHIDRFEQARLESDRSAHRGGIVKARVCVHEYPDQSLAMGLDAWLDTPAAALW